MTPTISVIMPVYNAERYVAQAVQSILDQTFRDFEFIIVDDGSTDRSLAILKKCAKGDSRIKLISRPNTGYVVALNEMLDIARGEFIARMDADDVSTPDRFKLQLAAMNALPSVVAIGGHAKGIDFRGRVLLDFRKPVDNAECQREALAGRTPIVHPAAMMRRTCVQNAGGYRVDLCPAEDLDLWLRLGEIGHLANVDEFVLQYRLLPTSVSATKAILQTAKMREACEVASKRRGVPSVFEGWPPREDGNAQSKASSLLRYGWWVYNNGHRFGAVEYSLRALRHTWRMRDAWKLIAIACARRPPARR